MYKELMSQKVEAHVTSKDLKGNASGVNNDCLHVGRIWGGFCFLPFACLYFVFYFWSNIDFQQGSQIILELQG